MAKFFITAAGTGLGKTMVTAALAWQMEGKVHAVKPVISGFDERALEESDSGQLLMAMQRPCTMAEACTLSPWRFKPALSPDMAARSEGVPYLPLPELVAWCRSQESCSEHLLVEAVGGVMAPLNSEHTVLDWVAALRYPTLLVGGSYLGALSHLLTAYHCLLARDIHVAAVLISETEGSSVSLSETVASLRHFIAAELLAIPYIGGQLPWKRAPDLRFLLKNER